MGKFFLCYIVLFTETSFPGSPGNYLCDLFAVYNNYDLWYGFGSKKHTIDTFPL